MSTEGIKVSRQVKEKLDEIKKRNGHSSYDSVIRELISKGAVIPIREPVWGLFDYKAICVKCLRWKDEKCTEATVDVYKVFPRCFLGA